MIRKNILMASAALALSSQTALSQELEVYYGADFVTNYISKGLTNSDDDPAFQPWFEVGYGLAYLSFWASNASFGGDKDIEYDLGVGVRPSIGEVDLDLGFVQYFYRDDDTDYGEAYLFADYDATDTTWLQFKYYREVYFDQNWFQVGAGYTGFENGFSISGNVGSDFGSRDFNQDLVAVDFGVTKEFSDHIALDVRAHYSSIEDERITAMLSFYN